MPESLSKRTRFFQDLADRHDTDILRSTFFEYLKSKRRLALLTEILAQVQVHMSQTHLTISDQVERKKEHDMRALKRQDIPALRQGAAPGRKVLCIWDRAGIDFRQSFEWK